MEKKAAAVADGFELVEEEMPKMKAMLLPLLTLMLMLVREEVQWVSPVGDGCCCSCYSCCCADGMVQIVPFRVSTVIAPAISRGLHRHLHSAEMKVEQQRGILESLYYLLLLLLLLLWEANSLFANDHSQKWQQPQQVIDAAVAVQEQN